MCGLKALAEYITLSESHSSADAYRVRQDDVFHTLWDMHKNLPYLPHEELPAATCMKDAPYGAVLGSHIIYRLATIWASQYATGELHLDLFFALGPGGPLPANPQACRGITWLEGHFYGPRYAPHLPFVQSGQNGEMGSDKDFQAASIPAASSSRLTHRPGKSSTEPLLGLTHVSGLEFVPCMSPKATSFPDLRTASNPRYKFVPDDTIPWSWRRAEPKWSFEGRLEWPRPSACSMYPAEAGMSGCRIGFAICSDDMLTYARLSFVFGYGRDKGWATTYLFIPLGATILPGSGLTVWGNLTAKQDSIQQHVAVELQLTQLGGMYTVYDRYLEKNAAILPSQDVQFALASFNRFFEWSTTNRKLRIYLTHGPGEADKLASLFDWMGPRAVQTQWLSDRLAAHHATSPIGVKRNKFEDRSVPQIVLEYRSEFPDARLDDCSGSLVDCIAIIKRGSRGPSKSAKPSTCVPKAKQPKSDVISKPPAQESSATVEVSFISASKVPPSGYTVELHTMGDIFVAFLKLKPVFRAGPRKGSAKDWALTNHTQVKLKVKGSSNKVIELVGSVDKNLLGAPTGTTLVLIKSHQVSDATTDWDMLISPFEHESIPLHQL